MTTIRTLALLIAMPLWTVATPAATEAPLALASFNLEVMLASGCVYYCDSLCDEGEHRIITAIYTNAESNHHETCNPGSCSMHECDPTFAATGRNPDALLDLEVAIKRSTPAELAAFVKANPARIRLNHERAALQLVGCNDAIVASYSSETIPALEALL